MMLQSNKPILCKDDAGQSQLHGFQVHAGKEAAECTSIPQSLKNSSIAMQDACTHLATYMSTAWPEMLGSGHVRKWCDGMCERQNAGRATNTVQLAHTPPANQHPT
jgi:hypothetical protein